MTNVALTIAGSDPIGGAGIQADLKTFHQFGVYGESVITLLTVQNTQRVSRVDTVSALVVMEQLRSVLEDIPPQAAKTGALGTAEIVESVAREAKKFSFPLVVDPVMISKHGAPLMSEEACAALRDVLLPHAALVTPNLHEASALAGFSVDSPERMRVAAERIRATGCRAVLVKGGHLAGPPLDILLDNGTFYEFTAERSVTRHTHGTGCTYSAAITAGLARGVELPEAVRQAKEYITRAIQTSPGLGSGTGPVNHFA